MELLFLVWLRFLYLNIYLSCFSWFDLNLSCFSCDFTTWSYIYPVLLVISLFDLIFILLFCDFTIWSYIYPAFLAISLFDLIFVVLFMILPFDLTFFLFLLWFHYLINISWFSLWPDYKHGVQLTTNLDNRVLMTFCASNEADRMKFVEDLNEAIMEVWCSVISIETLTYCF